MKFTNKQMVEECMTRIEHIQDHQRSVDGAAYFIRQGNRQLTVDFGNIRGELVKAELDEWRKLFMWAMTLDDADRDRIKAAGHARFLADKMHVADWINDGVSPGMWSVADENEFRVMAKKHFAPNE